MTVSVRQTIASVAVLVITACSGPGPTATRVATEGPTTSPVPSGTAIATASPSPTIATTASPSAALTASPSVAPTASAAPTLSPSAPPLGGAVEILAGGGTDAPRNGLAATSALLARPSGAAFDSDGSIWVVDSNLGLLIHVLADGTLADLATGLYGPEGVAAALDGTVYVANRGGYDVVKPSGGGGITRVAGDPLRAGFSGDGGLARKALLWLPYDVATDGANNVYVADSANQRIRLIDAGTLKIDTIVGNGARALAGDNGQALDAAIDSPQAIAIDAAGSVLLIADTGNARLRRVDLTTGIITTVAGSGGNAVNYNPALTGLQTPITRISALAMDFAGNAYFPIFWGDLGPTIMRLDPDGTMTRVIGGGRLSGPGVAPLDFALPDVLGLAVDRLTGDLLICSSDSRVYRVPAVGTPFSP